MSVSLYDIPPVCGHNVGGLHFLRIYPAFNVLSIPEAVDQVIPDEIQLADPENFADIWFPSGGFSEPMAEDSNGEYFRPQIQITVPKDAPDIALAIARLTGVRCVCIYIDGNSQAKLVGSLEAPLTFSSELDTGNDSGDKNIHKLTLKTEALHKAYFYLMFEAGAVPFRKVFSIGFSKGFLRSQLT